MDQLKGDEVQNGVESTLYDRFAATILAYLCQLVSNRQDAEDLLLEVFMVACKNEMLSGVPAGRQLAWLRRVARNKAVDRYRHTARLTMLPLEQARETEDEGLTSDALASCSGCAGHDPGATGRACSFALQGIDHL